MTRIRTPWGTMTKKIPAPVDKALRAALRNRDASLRIVGEATGIKWTTLANYEKGEAIKDGRTYECHISLAQAESLARYFGMEIELTKLKAAK